MGTICQKQRLQFRCERWSEGGTRPSGSGQWLAERWKSSMRTQGQIRSDTAKQASISPLVAGQTVPGPRDQR